MNLTEIGWEDVQWIYLARDKDQWRASVNTVMNLWVMVHHSQLVREEGFTLSQAWIPAIKVLQTVGMDDTSSVEQGRFQDGQEELQLGDKWKNHAPPKVEQFYFGRLVQQ